jgi:hypothetical protein
VNRESENSNHGIHGRHGKEITANVGLSPAVRFSFRQEPIGLIRKAGKLESWKLLKHGLLLHSFLPAFLFP